MRKALGAILFLAVAMPRLALAEAPPAGDTRPAKVKFDPATVVAMTGTVLAERRVTQGKGRTTVRLVLKSGDQQVSVHVGPESWLEKQRWTFAKGDEVTVKGSKFTFDGNVGLIAQSITRGKETLVLRDSSGKPMSGSDSQK